MQHITQKEKALNFSELHHSGKLLILPNIWDPIGALLLEHLEYQAVATASASVAYANGYNDGENIPFSDLLKLLKKITSSITIPVTADIESGYADNDSQLQKNILLLLDAGIVGINFEDTDKKTKALLSIETQCKRIRLIRKVADEKDIPLFINVRTDVYLYENDFSGESAKLTEVIKRGLAYKEAGADGFFPIVMNREDAIKQIIANVDLPLNVSAIAGIPNLRTLNKIGVARVSLGPGFLKIAINAMKELATQLKDYDGLSSITENEITSDYLKDLVNKNY